MTRLALLLPLVLALAGSAFAQDYGTSHRMKIDISGGTRKGVLFLPRDLLRNETLPLLIALPAGSGRAYRELGQWEKDAYDHRFAVFSVDLKTSLQRGWHPSETAEMQRDVEAVLGGIEQAKKIATEQGATLDESAFVLTGHSGGTYLTLWLGLRRPELFLGLCGRSVVLFPEIIEGMEGEEKIEHDPSLRIFLFHGQFDARRAKDGTQAATKMLRDKGYRHVKLEVVEGMKHESRPEVCLDWFVDLLRKTARGRKKATEIREEVEELRADLAQGRGSLSKLTRLVEKEKKAGFGKAARALLREVQAEAGKKMARAKDLEADGNLEQAMDAFREVEREYRGLDLAKTARKRRVAILRSDEYKAQELLAKAREWLERDEPDRARPSLERLLEKYPKTAAAEEAKRLLEGG